MNENKQSAVKRILGTRGMGAVATAFVGLIVIYIAFGLIDQNVFSGQNVMNLLRSMSKYLLIGVGQSYLLITGNIDLSIGSMVGMSAMISATMMTMGISPIAAMLAALFCCDIHRLDKEEGAAYGAAILAGAGTGVYASIREACQRRCLYGQQQPEHRCHCHRNRQRGRRQFSEFLLLRKDLWNL